MADVNEIMAAAGRLGNLISTHPAVQSYRELTRQLDLDIGARNLLGQFEQLIERLAAKEAQMQPIEIVEKQEFERLQQSIGIHPLLKKLNGAQREYMELMRQVQETINAALSGQPAPAVEEPAAPASKIILDS